MAFSPLASPGKAGPGLLQNPLVLSVATKHGVTPAQVVLGWNLRRGVAVVPHSQVPNEIADNLETNRVVRLDDADVKELDALHVQHALRTLAFDWLPFDNEH